MTAATCCRFLTTHWQQKPAENLGSGDTQINHRIHRQWAGPHSVRRPYGTEFPDTDVWNNEPCDQLRTAGTLKTPTLLVGGAATSYLPVDRSLESSWAPVPEAHISQVTFRFILPLSLYPTFMTADTVYQLAPRRMFGFRLCSSYIHELSQPLYCTGS